MGRLCKNLGARKIWPIIIMACLAAACQTTAARAPAGPPPYRQGYAQGCDSGYVASGHPYYAFRKDPARYERDRLYRQGWNDGFQVCKGRYDSIHEMY